MQYESFQSLFGGSQNYLVFEVYLTILIGSKLKGPITYLLCLLITVV